MPLEILPALINDIARVLYITMGVTDQTETAVSTKFDRKELPQLNLTFFGFFIEYALILLKLDHSSSEIWFDLESANLQRVAVVLDQLASRMHQLLRMDPKVSTEELQTVTKPLLAQFHMRQSGQNISVLIDGLNRSAIVLNSILKEAKKVDVDEGWLLWALEGYLTNKKTTLEQLKAGLNFHPPASKDFPKKDYIYNQAHAYVRYLEDQEDAERDIKFVLKAVPQWAKFLAKSPLLVYEW